MAQGDHIGIAACGSDGVVQVFALVGRRKLNAVGNPHHFPAQPPHGSLKRKVGASARLKEQQSHDRSFGDLRHPHIPLSHPLAQRSRRRKQSLQIITAELPHRDDVLMKKVACYRFWHRHQSYVSQRQLAIATALPRFK